MDLKLIHGLLRVSLGFWGIAVAFLSVLSPVRTNAAELTNGDFSAGLSGWQSAGSVFGSSAIAVLTDDGATRSLLYQPMGSATGAFTLSFDFRNALARTVPNGALADTFFASIYLADSLGSLDVPNGVFSQAISLFDLDSAGAFNVNGTLGASSKGADWTKFTLTFNSTHEVLAAVFDLRDLNTINNDSAVAIDNILLGIAIPEPATSLMAMIGVLGALLCRRWNPGSRSSSAPLSP